jgi:hypothetical protein
MRLAYFLFVFFATQLSHSLTAQELETYTAKSTYDEFSTVLISKLEFLINNENAGKKDIPATVRRINHSRIKYLKRLVSEELFISDARFQSPIDNIINRIVRANQLDKKMRCALIAKTPEVNAVNYGNGIYIITIGMLARLHNEDELALTLAHEIAHDELGHVRDNVWQNATTERQKETNKSLSNVIQGRADETELETLRNSIYQANRFHRSKELQADSLAALFFTRAGYNPSRGKVLFNILKEPTAMKIDLGIELLLHLHSNAYPIQDQWLRDRLSVYSKETAAPLGFSLDSLKSHPDIALRQKKFNYYEYADATESFIEERELRTTLKESEFELVELCYQKKLYDRCLFYALQLLHAYPHNSYTVSRIGKILLDLKAARDRLTFNVYVPRYTVGYNEHLKLVNNLLQNISVSELAELGYHFISDERHFNVNDPAHYYLKWKLCAATYRHDEEKEMKRKYRDKFNHSIDSYNY